MPPIASAAAVDRGTPSPYPEFADLADIWCFMPVRSIGTWKDSLRRAADATVASLLPGGIGLAPYLSQVDGYLYPHEAVFLYWLARGGTGSGAIVEIGSFRGRSTGGGGPTRANG